MKDWILYYATKLLGRFVHRRCRANRWLLTKPMLNGILTICQECGCHFVTPTRKKGRVI